MNLTNNDIFCGWTRLFMLILWKNIHLWRGTHLRIQKGGCEGCEDMEIFRPSCEKHKHCPSEYWVWINIWLHPDEISRDRTRLEVDRVKPSKFSENWCSNCCLHFTSKLTEKNSLILNLLRVVMRPAVMTCKRSSYIRETDIPYSHSHGGPDYSVYRTCDGGSNGGDDSLHGRGEC